ncbi:MAG: hypothetical protein AB8B91_26035, partial [Rubripirellula sp.]
ALTEIWRQHWSRIGPPPEVNEARFEQAILSRTFFDSAGLLVADHEDVPSAWVHFHADPDADSKAVVCAVCASDTCPPELLRELFEQTLARIDAAGFQKTEIGVAQDDLMGYGGLDPIGAGVGIPRHDSSVVTLLQQSGFQPSVGFVRLAVSVAGYRPPVSREGLQLRRSSRLEAQKLIHSDTRHASSTSHLDLETHRLVDRGGAVLAEVDFWFSDAEAEVMNPTRAVLDLKSQGTDALEPAATYLIGAAIQSFAARRISGVETVVPQQAADLQEQLKKQLFRLADEGDLWSSV